MNEFNNLPIVEELIERKHEMLDSLSNPRIKIFSVSDIEIKDKEIFFQDKKFSNIAVEKILKRFQLRDKFLEEVGPKLENWEVFKNNLKDLDSKARIISGFTDDSIVDIFFEEFDSIKDIINFVDYYDIVVEAVSNSERKLKLKNMFFDGIGTLNFQFIDLDTSFEVGTEDLWKCGHNINVDLFNLSVSPFFERLQCTNGNVVRHQSNDKNYHIKNKKFNRLGVNKLINDRLNSDPSEFSEIIKEKIERSKKYNVSVAEFYEFKKRIGDIASGIESLSDIMYKRVTGGDGTGFDDTLIKKAYGTDIESKSKKWRSSADTGINAYDFFNSLTWVASHKKEYPLSNNDALKLQIEASDFLFKKNLDLEDLAPQVSFN